MTKEAGSYEDLLAALGEGRLAPVYLLHGEEDFLVEEATHAIIDAALGALPHELNLDVLYADEHDVRDIVARASSFPMMGERRVVVVRAAERFSPKELELLLNYVEHPSPTTCLILSASRADMRRQPWVAVKRTGVVLECKPLYDNQLPSWITARVARHGGTIDPEASKLLAAYVGSSLREIQNEIDKVFIYLGQKRAITPDDIAAVVGISKEFSIFELQKAIGGKNLRRSMQILEHMLEAGENTAFIVVMLTNYFVSLLKLHELQKKGLSAREQASELKVNPYFLRDFEGALERYDRREVERSFSLLAEADEQIKGGVGHPKQVMQALLIRLQSVEEPAHEAYL